MNRRPLSQKIKRWSRFIVGGAVNTGFTYGIYLGLNTLMAYQLAYFIAYATGILFSYWFNAVAVFKTPLSWRTFCAYPLVYAAQYAASAILLGVLVDLNGVNESIAPLVVTVGMIPLTYSLSKLILNLNRKGCN